MPTLIEIARCRLSQAAYFLIITVAAGGCAAVGETLRRGGELVAGTPPPTPQAVETVASSLPFPYNIIAIALGGAVAGIWGHQYRRRLLKTDPAKVD